jgi:hypothetical protein
MQNVQNANSNKGGWLIKSLPLYLNLFALPVILMLFIAMITVSFQTIKTALENPTNSRKQR